MNALVNLASLLKSAKEIFPFHGGVHPPENKAQSTQLPIAQLSLPEKNRAAAAPARRQYPQN